MWHFIKALFRLFGLILKGIFYLFSETKKEIVRYNESFYVNDRLMNVLKILPKQADKSWCYIPASEFQKVYHQGFTLFELYDDVYFNYGNGCFCLKPKDDDWCILVCYGEHDALFVRDCMSKTKKGKVGDFSTVQLFNVRMLLKTKSMRRKRYIEHNPNNLNPSVDEVDKYLDDFDKKMKEAREARRKVKDNTKSN